jgi:cobalamin biosynthetic protein CobC
MALFERLAGQAILTRPFEAQPHWLRIGLPADAMGLARLERALRHG